MVDTPYQSSLICGGAGVSGLSVGDMCQSGEATTKHSSIREVALQDQSPFSQIIISKINFQVFNTMVDFGAAQSIVGYCMRNLLKERPELAELSDALNTGKLRLDDVDPGSMEAQIIVESLEHFEETHQRLLRTEDDLSDFLNDMQLVKCIKAELQLPK